MIDFAYLAKGLNAMARAHQVNTMAGHLGAAVVSGYFISEQHPDLDESVCAGIEADLDKIIAGQSAFSPRQGSPISAPEMFKPLPQETPREDLIDGIADALEQNIGSVRASGHNVIFAAIAIRGLGGHPEFATPSVTDGIRKLIAGFDNSSPGSGYYGKQKGRINGRQVVLPDDDSFPPYEDFQSMASAVLDELIRHASQRRSGFGGLAHVINHAAALVELALRGYREIALEGLAAHHRHMRLLKSLPDVTDELGAETPTRHDPRSAPFWQSDDVRYDRARLTHRVKTLYGFDALVELVENQATRRQGNDKLRYLM